MDITRRVALMERFTERYQETSGMSKSFREVVCLRELFPEVFVPPRRTDLFVGRFIVLPVGHGLEWANLGGGDDPNDREDMVPINGASTREMNSGGPSYYGRVDQLTAMRSRTRTADLRARLDRLIAFWKHNDTHTQAVDDFSTRYDASAFGGDITDLLPPILVLTRLSGLQLDHTTLLEKGLPGLLDDIEAALADSTDNEFLAAGVQALALMFDTVSHYVEMLEAGYGEVDEATRALLISSLRTVRAGPPTTLHSAIQLMFLYDQLAGVVNYGRLDDELGPFLERDLSDGTLTEERATTYLESLWYLIDDCCNRGNGRVIIGGAGRRNPHSADIVARLAIRTTMSTGTVKPQLTLRVHDELPEDIYDLALDAIGRGCTFPMLYNDSVNVGAVATAMAVSRDDAEQYVPYGCGEYVIYGRGTGSPNVCVNFTKVLQLALNKGIDPFDGVYRGGDYRFVDVGTLDSYEKVEAAYFDYLDHILEITVRYQIESYRFMAARSSFVLPSLLMRDCIARGKPILEGGVRYYGGVNEFYGFSNAIDSLRAIESVVFEERMMTLQDLMARIETESMREHDVDGRPAGIAERLKGASKFGNDEDSVDTIATRLHDRACAYIRNRGREVGLHSFLAVNINNNTNTLWGLKTAASPDGRARTEHLAPGNNPHSGRDTHGITAMLNSISKFRPDIHGGYVQNLKCTPTLFNGERGKVKMLLDGYFARPGGTQIMITVTDQATLLDAQANPERHRNLIVRCGGFSARFVELDVDTQNEIIQRTSNG